MFLREEEEEEVCLKQLEGSKPLGARSWCVFF